MLFYKLNTIWIQFICKLLNKIDKTAPHKIHFICLHLYTKSFLNYKWIQIFYK